jgi:hypothetical protein
MVDSHGEDIIEEDRADAQAESYVWKYFVDSAEYGTSLQQEAVPSTLSACSVTGLLLVFRPHAQFLMFPGVQSWDRVQLV